LHPAVCFACVSAGVCIAINLHFSAAQRLTDCLGTLGSLLADDHLLDYVRGLGNHRVFGCLAYFHRARLEIVGRRGAVYRTPLDGLPLTKDWD
jgi:hypothetical protein